MTLYKKKRMKSVIKSYKKDIFELDLLLDTFDLNKYEYAFVGGWVRFYTTSFSSNNQANLPTDIDIIVKIPSKEIQSILDEYRISYTKNDFGSFKIITNQTEIDIWSFYNHAPFKNGHFKPLWKNIPKSSYTTLDGATFTNKGKLYLDKIQKSVDDKFVDLTTKDLYGVENKFIIVAKLVYYYCLGFKLSDRAKLAVNNYLKTNNIDKLQLYFQKKYNQTFPKEIKW